MRITRGGLACLLLVAAWPAHAELRVNRVTVSTAATVIVTGPNMPVNVCPTSPACQVLVRNPSSVSVYIGTADVTTATGFELAAGSAITIQMMSGESLYGIVAAATEVVQTVTPGLLTNGAAGGGVGLTDVELRASLVHVACDTGCAAGVPGQQTMAGSSPVVIASNQSAVPVTLASTAIAGDVAITAAALPLPAGAATEAGHLAAIDTSTAKIPAQGQALAAASVPVVLTAIQVTALTPPAAITGFALDATLTSRIQKTQITDGTRDGTLKAASTLPAFGTDTALVVTQRDALPAGTNVIGHTISDTGSTTAVTQATAANLNATVTPLALTKGVQGAVGFTVQRLQDAGRTIVHFTADNVVPILTTDTLVTFVKLVGDTSTAGVTTYPVTSGKTLRLTSLSFSMNPSSTTASLVRLRLRTLTTSPCIASSPLVGIWALGSRIVTSAASAGGSSLTVSFPDGLEFSGATRNLCLSMNALTAAAQLVTITITGYEY